MKVALHNLGCKVNSYELDKIAGELIASGFELVPFKEGADVYIVNTCTVTNIADRKSRQMLHRAKKLNPHALVVALGCYVDTSPDCGKKDDCIDIALSNKEKEKLPEMLDEWAKKTANEINVQNTYRSHTRAYVKIQDGCNVFCTYCIIPFARGRSVSRPVDEVLSEVKALAAAGVKEIVLTGIHISSYGLDFAIAKNQVDQREEPKVTEEREGNGDKCEEVVGIALHDLVKRVNAIEGIERIRLGSLEPRTLTDEVLNTYLSCEKLCPHFHLSLQSGSESVLERMHRRYSAAEYAQAVAKLRQAYDNPAITTDVITGFPGETEEEFEESRRFIEQMDFYETHVFPYSVRKGTKAEKMPGQHTARTKTERAEILIKMSAEHAKRYRAQFIGKQVRVLWEDKEDAEGKPYLIGHTERYVRVAVPIEKTEQPKVNGTSASNAIPVSGQITEVIPTGFLNDETLLVL